jgi:hypothetical protein
MDRPIDRLGFGVDPHDLVTRLALRTPEFLGLILGHRLAILTLPKFDR